MAVYVLLYLMVFTAIVNGLFYDELMSDCHGLPFQCMMSKQSSSGGTKPISGFGSTANLFQSQNQQQQEISIKQSGIHNYNSGFVPGGLGINPADMSAVLKKQGKTDGPFVIKNSIKMNPFNPNTNGVGQSIVKGPFGGGSSNVMNGMMGSMGSRLGNGEMSGMKSMMGIKVGSNSVNGVQQVSGSGSSSMLGDCDKDWMHCPQDCLKSNPVLGCLICTCRKTNEGLEQNGINNYNTQDRPKPWSQHDRVHQLNGTPNPTTNKESKCISLPKTCPEHCVEFTQLGCLKCGCDLEPEREMCPYFPECPRGYVKMDARGCAVCTFESSMKNEQTENSIDWYRSLWGN